MNSRTLAVAGSGPTGGDTDLASADRELDDRFAADADRYSRWAKDLSAAGDLDGAELARRRADHLSAIVRERAGATAGIHRR